MAINTRINIVRAEKLLSDVFPEETRTSFTHTISITVPGTCNVNELLDASVKQFFDNYTAQRMTEIFGGITATSGSGIWQDENGNWVNEPVTVISSLTVINDDPESVQRLIDLRDLAESLKTFLRQESLLVTVTPVSSAYFL